MRVFRLHRRQRLAADYSGSLLSGSRWNPPGTPMLYAAPALSLGCLEILVHLDFHLIPLDYVYSSADLLSAESTDFHGDLKDEGSTQRFGHRWITNGNSLAMRVPSAIIPIEFNVLLNPVHSAFTEIAWSAPETFEFDKRLLRPHT